MKHNCYKNLKRLGRAKYICNICKEDLSLELVCLYSSVGKVEFNKITKEVK